LLSLLYLSR
jgi:ADP-ribosylation factor-binding protein GGA